jgi:hypothetical protein
VRGLATASEHGERLVFRRGREGDEAEIRLAASLRHAAEELLHVVAAFLGRPLLRFFKQSLAAEHFFEICRRLAALRAVSLVDDDGATPCRQRARSARAALLSELEQLARDERELLQRGDDHRNRILERFGELP